MNQSRLKKFSHSKFFLFGLFVMIAISLFVMQSISSNSASFSNYYFYLLIFNISLAIILLGIILANAYQLIRQVIKKTRGSRLQLKLSGILIFVSIVPLAIFFFFTIKIINQGMEDWFNVKVDQVVVDALDLSKTIVNIDFNTKLRQINQVALFLSKNETKDILATVLERQRSQIKANELIVLNNARSVIASASVGVNFLPTVPTNSVFDFVKGGNSIVNSIKVKDSQVIQILVKIPILKEIFLYALFPISDDISTLSKRINNASVEYQKLISLRKPLQESLSINLFLGLLLALFSSIFVALRLTERFISPITQLAIATTQISEGNFNIKLENSQKDELGFLVRAFKIMTNKIQTSNAEIAASQSLLEERNDYLQDLLANMSSGVLCLNSKYDLIDYNRASEDILGINFSNLKNQSIEKIVTSHEQLEKMVDLVRTIPESKSVQLEIKSTKEYQSSRVLVCKIKKQIQYGKPVYLIIFDDVTELLEAQRESAWSEVAKRMAHEIKNPLTPIQLSAERINRKYSKLLDEDNQIGLSNMTQTINNQVHTIKKMVEAFIQYGKNPKLAAKQVDINQLLTEIGNLYTQEKSNSSVEIIYDLASSCKIMGDEDRLRQLFNNLIKNSIEAITNIQETNTKLKGQIEIKSQMYAKSVKIIFVDNGGGIETEILDQIFVPYISSKPKGTGLGMAIVKKIIEEHGAKIQIKNLDESKGTKISIEFPLQFLTNNNSLSH